MSGLTDAQRKFYEDALEQTKMYDAACQRLGIPNDLETDESGG